VLEREVGVQLDHYRRIYRVYSMGCGGSCPNRVDRDWIVVDHG